MTAPQRFVDFRRPSDRAAVEGGTLAGGLKSLPYEYENSVGEAFQASRCPPMTVPVRPIEIRRMP